MTIPISTRTTIKGPCGALLHLDRSQYFPDDPGNGTPALVEYKGAFGTYWCVCETADCDGTTVPPSVLRWLDSDKISNMVEETCR